MHNLEVLDIFEDTIFNNKAKLYHPCNLNIFITNICQNKCFFCINHKDTNTDIPDKVYYHVLETVLKELQNKHFEITITGGEPTLDLERFVKTMQLCSSYNFPCRTVSTTGLQLLTSYNGKPVCQYMVENNFIHNINISRMHWDEKKNLEILNGKNIDNNDIEKLALFFRFNDAEMRISCNLIPNYVDNFSKMLNFVDYYRGKNIETIMFREIVGNNSILLKDVLKLNPENGFYYLKTLDGLIYSVDVYKYKDMLVKHYITKHDYDKSVILSFALKNAIFMDGFSGKNIYLDLKGGCI